MEEGYRHKHHQHRMCALVIPFLILLKRLDGTLMNALKRQSLN